MSGKLNYQVYKKDSTDDLDKDKPEIGTISSFAEVANIINSRVLTIELTGWMTVAESADIVLKVIHDDGITIDLLKDYLSDLTEDKQILKEVAVGTHNTTKIALNKMNAYKIKIRLTNSGGPGGLNIQMADKDMVFSNFYSNVWTAIWQTKWLYPLIIFIIIIILFIMKSATGSTRSFPRPRRRR